MVDCRRGHGDYLAAYQFLFPSHFVCFQHIVSSLLKIIELQTLINNVLQNQIICSYLHLTKNYTIFFIFLTAEELLKYRDADFLTSPLRYAILKALSKRSVMSNVSLITASYI